MSAFPNILTLTFSQAVTLGTGSLTVYDAATDAAYISYPVSAMTVAGAVVTIDISNDFPDNGSWYVNFDSGLFVSVFGQTFPLTSKTEWKFSVRNADFKAGDWKAGDWFTA